MATVWAPFRTAGVGQWTDRAYESGWSHTVQFSSLRDLLNSMASRGGLRGAVTRLGVVAHGDRQGLIQLDRDITVTSLKEVARELNELRLYLARDGMMEFYSCNAAAGAEGSQLLCGLSNHLPGRTVVGFTVFGETDAGDALSAMAPQTPGRVREAPHGKGSGRPGRDGILTPWHATAKWARDGRIVRAAPIEREPDNRCANPACPGHSSALHHCQNWVAPVRPVH